MKLNILARGLALTIMIFPGVVFSLGLGEIEVISALNQPLRAEITLFSVRHDEIEDLRVTLAPMKAFKRIGIDRPFVLSQLKFNPVVSSSGQVVIQITTVKPVREPFLNFLVEVQWPKGQLLREYTILLDPPVFTEEQHSAGVQPPVAGTNSKISNENDQPRAVHQNSAAGKDGESGIDHQGSQSSLPVQGQSQAEPSAVVSSSQQPQTYNTIRGDTLSEIALDRRPHEEIGLSEMMMALLRANPQAFLRDNINELMAGVILRMPTSEELASIDRGQAINDVARHNALWREYRSKVASSAPAQLMGPAGKGMISHNPPVDGSGESSGRIDQGNDLQQGNLEILAADSNAGSQESISTGNEVDLAALSNDLALSQELAESRLRENEQLKSKVQDLEGMLGRQERLINLQSDELSDLQQRLSGAAASPEIKTAVDLEGIEDGVGTAIEAEGFKSTDGVVQADIELGTDDGSEMIEPEELGIELLESEELLLSDQPEVTEPEQIENVVVEDPPISAQPDPSVEIETKEQSASITSSIGNLIDDLMAKPIALAAIAGTGLLLMLFLLWKVVPRGRKGTGGSADQPAVISEDLPEEFTIPAVSDAGQASNEDDESPVEDPSHAGESEPAGLAGAAISKQAAGAPDTVAQVGPSTGGDEKDETLTEAEVYIAYGLHQQAEELLKDAIEKRPERDDYRLKLLEAYHGSQNGEAFDTLASEIHGRQGADADSWERVLTMGRELNPNNPLYDASMASGSAAPTADSNDEIGRHEDETLIGERPQGLNFDETEIVEQAGESSLQDSGSGYTSDIVQELDSSAVTNQDVQLDQQISAQDELGQEDGGALEFDISELQLNSDEELEASDSQSQETGLSYDETIDFEASDLDIDAISEGLEQESKDHEAVAVDVQPDGLELNINESLTPADSGLTEESESSFVAEGGGTEGELSELDDELTILGGDLDLDSEIDVQSEAIDTAAESDEPVDEISVEDDAAEIDLMQLGLDDLDSGTTTDDLTDDLGEVSAVTQEPLLPADEVLSEDYDPGMDSGEDLELINLDVDSSPDDLGAGLEEAQGHESLDGLDAEAEALDQELQTVDEVPTTDYDPSLDGELDPAGVEAEYNLDVESAEAQIPTETFSMDQEGGDGINDAEELETILSEVPEDQEVLAGIASDQQVLDSDVDEALAGVLGDQDDDETSGFQAFDASEEVSTKLDLAKAYLDMGDNDGARNALEEVVQEGDGEQRKEAEEMIRQIA